SLLKALGTEKGFKVLSRRQARALPFDSLQAYIKGYKQLQKAAKPALETLKKSVSPVSVSDFVDHIDYLVKKMGIDHVGISSDFDGGGGIEGWQDASETFNVTLELVKRGYTEEEIGKLWSGNLLRVLEEVRLVAEKLQGKKKA
ncbi:MAG: membrane dipeptidase, partial [Flavobacteriaceae bacterium]